MDGSSTCNPGFYGNTTVLCEQCESVFCPEGAFLDLDACAGANNGCTACETPQVGEYCPANSTLDAGVECPAGFYCAGGGATRQECSADEGFYCPAGFNPAAELRRAGSDPLEGVPCPPGYYCAGNTADAVPCEAEPGFYCPGQFAPAAASLAEGLAGKPCTPGLLCEGLIEQPIPHPPVCDLVKACGPASVANETCGARQSTFFKYQDPPTSFAVDGNSETCMKTADATADPNAQWVRVDLGSERLIGTVRFSSAGSDSRFSVAVSKEDAAPSTALNPSAGSAMPAMIEQCPVTTSAPGVLEASCPPATRGQFVFILRTNAKEILEVCDVEVFRHQCMATEHVWCPFGYEPALCADAVCRGCVPCLAGSYSDKEGSYECTPCPGVTEYGERPYSPEGSTSVFQCEGDAYLDGTSTLEVDTVLFDTAKDAWEIEIEFSVAPRIQINGLSTLFMSTGRDSSPANDCIFESKNFPCRADTSRAAGSDVSASLEETVCCLQDVRQQYVMTKIFREFTDGLDLVAANDKCDASDGSEMLVSTDLDVIGEDGTQFVDTNGNVFANSIKVEPIPAPTQDRRADTGPQRAKITIPDAELYQVSKLLNPNGNLTDSREIFIGLLDLLPTGTRVVDSASQQISIVLTRTQYGTFSAYGEQNIDYDFISFLNARVHTVMDQSIDTRRGLYGDQFYAEVTFVYDDSLQPINATGAVELDSVTVNGQVFCDGEVSNDFMAIVANQTCGPQQLAWKTEACPQVSIPDDHFGRLYIPLPQDLESGVIHIEFALWFTDMGGRNDKVMLAMDLVMDNFVTWCDADKGSVDLAKLVSPRIIVGTKSDSPQRLQGWDSMVDTQPFATGAETLQDGLVTLILDLDEEKGSIENLEVFIEDALVIHVNPGSQPDVNEIKSAITGQNHKFLPTHNYDPDSCDAWLNIPDALKTACPAEDATTSFFGCVHKHILRNKVITNETDAYFVGSAPAGAQDFVETMLGDGTASVASRELGRDFESYLMTREGVTGSSRKSIGLWINLGHRWGGITANSEYSLSNNLIIHVLLGVQSGVDGSERSMLLSTNGDGTTSLVRTLEYNVHAATLVESVMDDVIAIEVEARLSLSAEEACLPLTSLRELCSERLEASFEQHASKVERVECVSVTVENANCGGTRRSAAAPVAVVDAVIALADTPDALVDLEAVVASGRVLAMKQTAGNKVRPSSNTTPAAGQVEAPGASGEDDNNVASSNTTVIGAAAGAAAGVVLLALVAWLTSTKCRAPADPLMVPAGVVAQGPGLMDKVAIEGLLFGDGAVGAQAGPGRADSQKRLLEQV